MIASRNVIPYKPPAAAQRCGSASLGARAVGFRMPRLSDFAHILTRRSAGNGAALRRRRVVLKVAAPS